MLKALFIIWIFHIYYHWSTYIVTLTIGIGKAVPDLLSYLYKDVEDTRVLISTSSNWGETEQESDELVTEEQRCATLAEQFSPYAKFCGSPVMTAFQSFIIFYLLELWYLVVLLRIFVRNEVASLERDKSDVEQKLRDTERELKQAAENLAQVNSEVLSPQKIFAPSHFHLPQVLNHKIATYKLTTPYMKTHRSGSVTAPFV